VVSLGRWFATPRLHPGITQEVAPNGRVVFPLLIKPNIGGSGAGIARFDTRDSLEAALYRLDLGPDHTALLQEYVEPEGQAITRIEVLGGRFLYAFRIVKETESRFNLCPADLCEVPSEESPGCPAVPTPGMSVRRIEPPPEAIETALRVAAAASIDIGGIEYPASRVDGR
jgi:hypothetical protein